MTAHDVETSTSWAVTDRPYRIRPLLAADFLIEPLFDHQLILDLKDTGHALGRHVCQLAVALIQHSAFQSDMTILHDDVNLRNRLSAVSEQRRIVVENCSIERDAKIVVHGRERQDFN